MESYARRDPAMAKTLLKLALSQKANFPKRNAALELQRIIEAEEAVPDPYADFDDEPIFEVEDEKEK